MFLVGYEFTFDAGMRLLLLLLQHRQQHLVAQRCENGAVRIGWHNALQDLPAKHLRMVKIKQRIAQLRMRRIIIRDSSQN